MYFTTIREYEGKCSSKHLKKTENILEKAAGKILEYKVLMKSLPEEEIKEILQKNIGSRNMTKLSAMTEFLRIEKGSQISERFIKNIVLLALLYGPYKGKRELSFAELVFQALYETFSK